MHSQKTAIQLIDSLYRGGAQKVVLETVRCLPEYKHVVCYWATEKQDLREEFERLGVILVQLPFDGVLTFPKALKAFRGLKRVYKPDFVHSHMLVPNLLARLSGKKRVKNFATYHGECFEQKGLKGFLTRYIEKLTLPWSDEVIVVSNYIEKYLRDKLHTAREICVTHNFGEGAPGKRSDKSTFPLRLVAVGNGHSYKGYPTLIEAFARLKEKKVTLDIYGEGIDGMKIVAERFGATNVTFNGSVSNMVGVLPKFDAYVAASVAGEGFSLALLEAMHTGLPVICSDIPQFVEAVGDAGIVFKRSNVPDLVSKIEQLVDSPDKLRNYSARITGRSELFSKSQFVKKTRSLYDLP